jgi:hypothetical protein
MEANKKKVSTNRLLRLIVVIAILAIVGPIAIFGVFLELFLLLTIDSIRIYDDVQAVQDNLRLAVVRKRNAEKARVRELEKNVAEAERRITEAEKRAKGAEAIASKTEIRAKMAEKRAQKADMRVEEVEELLEEAKEEATGARKRAAEAERRLSILAQIESNAIARSYRSDNDQFPVQQERSIDPPHLALIPKTLRTIDPLVGGFTCIGTTKKGARCGQWMIANEDKRKASKQLQRMKSGDPGDSFEYNKLLELARLMLCEVWHKDKKPQGPGIAMTWYNGLKPARESLEASSGTKMSIEGTPSNTVQSQLYLLSSSGGSSSASFGSGSSSIASLESSSGRLASSPPSSAGDSFDRRKPSRTGIGDPVKDLTPTFAAMRNQQS